MLSKSASIKALMFHIFRKSSPNISDFMIKMGYTQVYQVQEYYTKIVTDMVNNVGARVIVWVDPVDKNVTVSLHH